MVRKFIELCTYLGVPVAPEKTIWASTRVKFLGIEIDGLYRRLLVPQDKKDKARHMLQYCLEKKKVTVKFIERLSGFLNFLNKAIYPGRAFTPRMYAKIDRKIENMRQYHHISLDSEFRSDCKVWLEFLDNSDSNFVYCRPFTDLSLRLDAKELNLYTDSSANPRLGCGGIFDERWFFGQWEYDFIRRYKPSIAYLELYAVCMAVFIWREELTNLRFQVHCDNESVVRILNTTSSGCKHCMQLIRRLILLSLRYNMRIFGLHVRGIHNSLSDSLSRLQFKRFWRLASAETNSWPDKLDESLWPTLKIWVK